MGPSRSARSDTDARTAASARSTGLGAWPRRAARLALDGHLRAPQQALRGRRRALALILLGVRRCHKTENDSSQGRRNQPDQVGAALDPHLLVSPWSQHCHWPLPPSIRRSCLVLGLSSGRGNSPSKRHVRVVGPDRVSGRRNEFGPGAVAVRHGRHLGGASADCAREIDELEVDARHQVGHQGDGLAAGRRKHGRRGGHEACGRCAPRRDRRRSLVEPDEHDIEVDAWATRRPGDGRACRRPRRPVWSSQSVSLSVRLSGKLEHEDADRRATPCPDCFASGCAVRADGLGVCALGRAAGLVLDRGLRAVQKARMPAASIAAPGLWRLRRAPRDRANDGERPGDQSARHGLVRRRPVVADAGLDHQRHRRAWRRLPSPCGSTSWSCRSPSRAPRTPVRRAPAAACAPLSPASASAAGMRTMARLMMSAAPPWIGALIAGALGEGAHAPGSCR